MPANDGLSGKVMTVLGPVEPRDLGITCPHEHLIIDFLTVGAEAQASHGKALEEAGGHLDWEEPISLCNYYRARRNPFHLRDTLQLTDLDAAATSLAQYRDAGGGCIVDVTPIGVGRDPSALRTLSEQSGVHVVMGTGYYVNDFHTDEVRHADEGEVRDLILADMELGSGPDAVRPGIIGEIGLVWPVHERERTVLRAAARVQSDSGYCLTVHPGRDPRAPLDAITIVEAAGGDPRRTIIDHLDRTLFEDTDYLALARTGCYLEFDLFGHETSYYPIGDIDMPNDAMRLNRIAMLAEKGHLDQVLISHDIDTKARLTPFGGEGYQHIIEHVVPVMRRKGFTDDEIDRLLKTNPQRALTIQ